jgi:hypothetical protein
VQGSAASSSAAIYKKRVLCDVACKPKQIESLFERSEKIFNPVIINTSLHGRALPRDLRYSGRGFLRNSISSSRWAVKRWVFSSRGEKIQHKVIYVTVHLVEVPCSLSNTTCNTTGQPTEGWESPVFYSFMACSRVKSREMRADIIKKRTAEAKERRVESSSKRFLQPGDISRTRNGEKDIE